MEILDEGLREIEAEMLLDILALGDWEADGLLDTEGDLLLDGLKEIEAEILFEIETDGLNEILLEILAEIEALGL